MIRARITFAQAWFSLSLSPAAPRTTTTTRRVPSSSTAMAYAVLLIETSKSIVVSPWAKLGRPSQGLAILLGATARCASPNAGPSN